MITVRENFAGGDEQRARRRRAHRLSGPSNTMTTPCSPRNPFRRRPQMRSPTCGPRCHSWRSPRPVPLDSRTGGRARRACGCVPAHRCGYTGCASHSHRPGNVVRMRQGLRHGSGYRSARRAGADGTASEHECGAAAMDTARGSGEPTIADRRRRGACALSGSGPSDADCSNWRRRPWQRASKWWNCTWNNHEQHQRFMCSAPRH